MLRMNTLLHYNPPPSPYVFQYAYNYIFCVYFDALATIFDIFLNYEWNELTQNPLYEDIQINGKTITNILFTIIIIHHY